MALRACTVSFIGATGVRHSVEVTAESVYEAAAAGISKLRQDGWADPIGRGTQWDVQVREIAAAHCVSVAQIERWCEGVATSPDEVLRRKRVKALLQMR